MKRIILLSLAISSCGFNRIETRPANVQPDQNAVGSIYDFKMQSLEGEVIDFSNYKGRNLLIVNVASECGFTPQYADLQELHEKYGDKITVLGFPANNFGGQEPGTNAEIAAFCQKNYGVDFQMFEKISVKGSDQARLYSWLSKKENNGWNDQEPSWNFCKYLVNGKGELVKFYGSAINPQSEEILSMIEP